MNLVLEAPRSAAEDDVRELVAAVREFADHELTRRAWSLDGGGGDAFEDCWRRSAAIGLDRALLDPEFGGAGVSAGAFLGMIEEVARAEAGLALCLLGHNLALAAAATDAADGRRERWMLAFAPAAAAGETISFAPGVVRAETIVVDLGPEGFRGFAATGSGLSTEPIEAQMGLRAAPGARVTLPAGGDWRPAPGDVAGASSVRCLAHLGVAAISRGIARRAYELALAYAGERYQGGTTIIHHGAVRDALGRMAGRAELRRPEWSKPLPSGSGHRGADAMLAHSMALNLSAAEAAIASATDAVQVFGGAGYMRDSGVEKLMRDAAYMALLPAPRWILRDMIVELETR